MPIISLHQAHFILRAALLSDWMSNSLYEFGGCSPNQVIENEGLQPVIQRMSEILGMDFEGLELKFVARNPLELDRQLDSNELVFDALAERLGCLLSRSWYQQSLNVFQGKTANEVLGTKRGEEIVIEEVRKLAIDLLTKPTCVVGEYGARFDYDLPEN